MTATTEPTGTSGERDVAALWRLCFTWAFYVHAVLGFFATFGGIFVCIGNAFTAVGFVCMLCGGISFLFKCAIFWWAVVLRLSEEGRVTAGKLVEECKEKLSEVPIEAAPEEPVSRLLEEIVGAAVGTEPAAEAAASTPSAEIIS